jgi:hypothetical protein
LYIDSTREDEDGGVGEGDSSPENTFTFGGEDPSWVELSRNVDAVAREPGFLEHLAFILDPSRNGRYVFPSRLAFGPVGPILDGGEFTETRDERTQWGDAKPVITVNGKLVEAAQPTPGVFEIDLLAFGEGPLSVRAYAKSPTGEDLSAGLDVAPGKLSDMRAAAELALALAQDPASAEKRTSLAALVAAAGSPEAAAVAADAVAAADPAKAVEMLSKIYCDATAAAAGSGKALDALFLDALRDFHCEIASGARSRWECRSLEPRRLVIESMGSCSFLERARGAITLSGLEDVDAEFRTAAILALLRNETNPLSRWACYAGLQKCAIPKTARLIERLAVEEKNPFVHERAKAAADAASARSKP